MPDDVTKGPRPVVGRSKTHEGTHGKVVVLSQPLDRAYLCQKLCVCNAGTKIRNKLGHQLKQRCTTVGIWADEEINQLVWRYKAEVGFNMRMNPPAPLMSIDQPNRPSRFPLGRAMGEGLLKGQLEGGPQRGLLRIPDCIILRSTGVELAAMRASGQIDWRVLIPKNANIETVLEIKFAGDKLSRVQRQAYERIAGNKRFRVIGIGDCDCGLKHRVPATSPVRVPVTTPMKRESEVSRRWFQLPSPQPAPVPAPIPQLPRYEAATDVDAQKPLSQVLKEHPKSTSGVVLVGAILLAFPATRAALVVAAALFVVTNPAAATTAKQKDTK